VGRVATITLSRNGAYMRRLTGALGRPSDELRLLVNNGLTLSVEGPDDPMDEWAVYTPGWNTGYSEGANIGREWHRNATPDATHLLLLNDDLIPEPGFVSKMVERSEGFDVLGALILHSNGTVNHAGTAVWGSCRTDHIGRFDYAAAWHAPNVAVTAAVTFAAALIRTEVWDALGGLDERYVYGWEDPDFCLRAIRAGYRIGVARDAVAIHDECGTRPRGGARDQMNAQTFHQTWNETLPQVLRDYLKREPEAEGVRP
jgi:hypothetical protein